MRDITDAELALVSGGDLIQIGPNEWEETDPIVVTAQRYTPWEVVTTIPTAYGVSIGFGQAMNQYGGYYYYLGVGFGAGGSVSNENHSEPSVDWEIAIPGGVTVGAWIPASDWAPTMEERIQQYQDYGFPGEVNYNIP